MPNDVINQITIKGTTYDINGGGHVIEDPDGTDMTQRSNLQFLDAGVSDDSTNNRTKIENVQVIDDEDELDDAPDGMYMGSYDDADIVVDASNIGYDNSESGLNADNVQEALDLLSELDPDDFIQKSETSGFVKNDGSIDTNTYLNSNLKGTASGVAELDSNGKVPSGQLPSFVDDVLEYASSSAFPATGETGKIYVALDTNKTYRWGGSEYVEISESLALGETSSTAYRGDRGKTAYDHSQLTSGNPHNVSKSDVGLGNVDNTSDSTKKTNFTGSIASGNTGFVTGGDAYTALDNKVDKINGKGLSTNDYDNTAKGIVDNVTTNLANKVDWVSNGILGAKNLNAYPYYETSHTDNYVVWTDNGDGTVTANGTASATSSFLCHNRISGRTNELIVPNGKYIVSGCPSGGASGKYRINVAVTKNGSAVSLGVDYGEGVEITIDGCDYYNDKAVIQIGCDIWGGQTASNLVFKPMLRLASDTDSTFRPYAKTNKQLTDEVRENTEDIGTLENRADNTTASKSGNPISISGLKANQLAVNPIITLEPIQDLHGQSKPYPAGGGKNKLLLSTQSGTYNDVVTTVNSDGTILCNGTASGEVNITLYNGTLPSGTYRINGNPSGASSTTYRMRFRVNSGSWSYISSETSDPDVTLTSTDTLELRILITSGAQVSNKLWKPMIRLATETDATFAPYENICPISGYDKIEVLSCGVNVWDEVWESGRIDASGNNATSTVHIRSTNYIPVKSSNTYYCVRPNSNLYVAEYDKSKGFIRRQDFDTASTGTSFTLASNTAYIRFCIGGSSTPITTGANIGINYPSSLTTYVPCHKTTDISESLGQTVYGGTLDVRTGKLTVTWKKATFRWGDGSSSASLGSNIRRSFGILDSLNDSTSRGLAISDKCPNIIAYDQDSTHFYISSAGTLYVFLPNSTGADTTFDICYLMATPFTIQLTPHEISLLKDCAYVSTNGTSISLDYHNGEIASLGDVSQLGETVEKSRFHHYSTDEQIVGVWHNGKTLYEKTYFINESFSDVYRIAMSGIDELLIVGGFITGLASGSTHHLPLNYYESSTYRTFALFNRTTQKIVIGISTTYTVVNCKVIVQYTKQ